MEHGWWFVSKMLLVFFLFIFQIKPTSNRFPENPLSHFKFLWNIFHASSTPSSVLWKKMVYFPLFFFLFIFSIFYALIIRNEVDSLSRFRDSSLISSSFETYSSPIPRALIDFPQRRHFRAFVRGPPTPLSFGDGGQWPTCPIRPPPPPPYDR